MWNKKIKINYGGHFPSHLPLNCTANIWIALFTSVLNTPLETCLKSLWTHNLRTFKFVSSHSLCHLLLFYGEVSWRRWKDSQHKLVLYFKEWGVHHEYIYFSLATCFSDPGHCSDKGMTVMAWIKLNKTSLSNTTSSYIMSSGGQSTKSRGFAVVYLANKYIVILSTKNKQWKLDTPVLPSGWFNLAFTWREAGRLKLYVNGTHVTSGNPVLVSRPLDSFTTFDISRPNNSEKPIYRFPLRISNLALWERELSLEDLKSG